MILMLAIGFVFGAAFGVSMAVVVMGNPWR